jgi:hypothetical protein
MVTTIPTFDFIEAEGYVARIYFTDLNETSNFCNSLCNKYHLWYSESSDVSDENENGDLHVEIDKGDFTNSSLFPLLVEMAKIDPENFC